MRSVEQTLKRQQYNGQEEALLRRMPNDVSIKTQRLAAPCETEDDYRALVLGSEPGLRDDALLNRVRTHDEQHPWSPQTPIQGGGTRLIYSDDLLRRTTDPQTYNAARGGDNNNDSSLLLKRVTQGNSTRSDSMVASNERPRSAGSTYREADSYARVGEPRDNEEAGGRGEGAMPAAAAEGDVATRASRTSTRRSEDNGEAMLARASQLMGLDTPGAHTGGGVRRPPGSSARRRWL